ncbi:small ribosomal subunit protein uS11 [Prorops nasuta]|uniref:small ribosomal subunit protein uS11 n=1 Tax=Prorops nasuta TaxID=863751 RepID=UPI0034CE75AF
MFKLLHNLSAFLSIPKNVGNTSTLIAKYENFLQTRSIYITPITPKEIKDRHQKIAIKKIASTKSHELSGESTVDIDNVYEDFSFFPDEHTSNKLYSGVPYKNLNIANIKSTPNNTIINFTDDKGSTIAIRSCGVEGFKNAKKGTNIAAQQTAITLATQLVTDGYKDVRVRVQGIGPGRLSAIKGLVLGGMNVISITDTTRVTWHPLRPPKARKI